MHLAPMSHGVFGENETRRVNKLLMAVDDTKSQTLDKKAMKLKSDAKTNLSRPPSQSNLFGANGPSTFFEMSKLTDENLDIETCRS